MTDDQLLKQANTTHAALTDFVALLNKKKDEHKADQTTFQYFESYINRTQAEIKELERFRNQFGENQD